MGAAKYNSSEHEFQRELNRAWAARLIQGIKTALDPAACSRSKTPVEHRRRHTEERVGKEAGRITEVWTG